MAWAPDYATDAELKSYVRIDQTIDDAEVAIAITAASRAVDLATGRQFGKVDAAESRFYTAEYDRRRGRWTVRIDDLMDTTDLVVNFDSDDDGTYESEIDEYQLKPVNADKRGRPWTDIVVHPRSTTLPTALEDGVEVIANFGWSSVPKTIKTATLMQASRFLSRRDSPWGVAGSPDLGSEMRLLAKLDPDVAVIVSSYYRWWGAV